MAKENGDYGWKKQKTVELKCPSGTVAFVHRPGPDIGLRSGRVAEFFQALDPSDQEAMWDKLEGMSDEEAERIKKFVREVVLATIVSPKVYANPVGEQLGLDDIPAGDFWHIFNWGSSGGRTQPVKVGEGEVTVEAVDNFLKDKTQTLSLSLTAKMFSQRPSALVQIRDEGVALAFDFQCARELVMFEDERDVEREKRDREFWIAMFGGNKDREQEVIEGFEMEEGNGLRLGTR